MGTSPNLPNPNDPNPHPRKPPVPTDDEVPVDGPTPEDL